MINTLFSVTKYMSHIVLNKIVRMSSNATLDKATPTDRFSVSNPIIKLEWAPFYNYSLMQYTKGVYYQYKVYC